MSDITIYHNPQCGTSRNTLALIRNTGAEPRVIHYLETPPSRAELLALIAALGTPVREVMRSKVDIVYPSLSILAEPPVAVVDKNVDRKGTRAVAQAYLEYLYTDEGQDIAGKNFYRPISPNAQSKYADKLPKINLFTIDQTFGGWAKADKNHFADGGSFDQIYTQK